MKTRITKRGKLQFVQEIFEIVKNNKAQKSAVIKILNRKNIKGGNKATELEKTSGISVVPTMRDTITADSSW